MMSRRSSSSSTTRTVGRVAVPEACDMGPPGVVVVPVGLHLEAGICLSRYRREVARTALCRDPRPPVGVITATAGIFGVARRLQRSQRPGQGPEDRGED